MRTRGKLCTAIGSVAAVTALGLGGVSASAAPARAHAKLTNIAIGLASSSADQVMPVYAEKAGIFQQFGINASVSLISATSLMSTITTGGIQFAVNGSPQPEEAIAGGAPLRWVGVWSDRPDLVFLVGPGISSYKDLIGKPIGGTAAGSLTQILAQSVLSRNGVASNKVQWVNVGSPANLLAAFISHEIDAAVTGPPISDVALAKTPGAKALYNLSKNFAWPFAGLIVNLSYADHHQRVVEDVLKAMNLAMKDWRRHPAEAESVIQQETPGTTPQEAAEAYQSTLPSLNSSLLPNDTAEVAVLKTMRATDPSMKGMTVNGFIDTTFLKDAGLLPKASSNSSSSSKKNHK